MKPLGTTIAEVEMADNADIRRAITKATPKARMQAKKFAHKFNRGTEKQTCKAIFDYLKNNIKYVADGDHQIVQLPSALMRNKVGDCKSYSVFTSAVLSNLGIPHHYMYASYTNNPTPGHIYVVTDSGIIIDAVYGTFNAEKQANYKYPTNINGTMRVSTITGLGACCASCESGVGFLKILKRSPVKKAAAEQRQQERKDNRQEKRDARDECGKQGLKPVTLSAGRNLFLLIVQSNLDGFATKLSRMDQNKVRQNWCNVGGNPMSLLEAIRNGSQRPSKNLGLLGRLAKKAGVRVNGIGATVTQDQAKKIADAIVPAAIAAGAAVGVATGQPAQGTAGGASLGTVLKGILPIVIDAIVQLLPSEAGDAIAPPNGVDPVAPGGDAMPGGPGSGGDFDITNVLMIAGGLAAAYFIFKQ